MKQRIRWIWIFFAGLIFLIDPYVYLSLKRLLALETPVFPIVYWAIPFLLLLRLATLLAFHSYSQRKPAIQKRYFNLFGGLILFYIPKLFYMALSLMGLLMRTVTDLISMYPYRMAFMGYLGFVGGSILFIFILYGILYGRFHFKTQMLDFSHERIPAGFNGLRIVQISDLHIGSWVGHRKRLEQAIEKINSQNPDLILFTGDLFNNFYEEIADFKDILRKLNASYGKYAVLGNHDYGDYFPWPSDSAYRDNFNRIKGVYHDLGFHLLCNESQILRKNGHYIGIVGVENWGHPPFHQYGDLMKALSGIDGTGFNLLLSHDPSHWRSEVLQRKALTLTLSGHTHGMQFGFDTPWLKWSPAQAKYPEWKGLYREGHQALYVNPGLGYIGFPGRIGIRPEITVITLISPATR